MNRSPEALLSVVNLRKWYAVRRGFVASLLSSEERYLKAVDGVNFDIQRTEIFGLVGESGSGKTTTGRAILRLIEPTGGEVYLDGEDIAKVTSSKLKRVYRKKMQMIYQDPYASLNPRWTVGRLIAEGVNLLGLAETKAEKLEMVSRALEDVGLTPPESFLNTYPHRLSGGQRQRVSIARALVVKPAFIVADEPVSMLDASIRMSILNLIQQLRERLGISFLYITHDLASMRYVCDRAAVMYLGKIVEMAAADVLVRNPVHPYTRALIEALPEPDPDAAFGKVTIGGEIPDASNPPPGCNFHPRCPRMKGRRVCSDKSPDLLEIESGHHASCHFWYEA
jgi:peptide/nickel transport system ATP-binding protein